MTALQLDLFALTPTHVSDPESSREAARKVRPKASSQAALILDLLAERHPEALTTREIELELFDGQPTAQNKVNTRLRALWEKGLVERVSAADPTVGIPWSQRNHAEPLTRTFRDSSFLVYRATQKGLNA